MLSDEMRKGLAHNKSRHDAIKALLWQYRSIDPDKHPVLADFTNVAADILELLPHAESDKDVEQMEADLCELMNELTPVRGVKLDGRSEIPRLMQTGFTREDSRTIVKGTRSRKVTVGRTPESLKQIEMLERKILSKGKLTYRDLCDYKHEHTDQCTSRVRNYLLRVETLYRKYRPEEPA